MKLAFHHHYHHNQHHQRHYRVDMTVAEALSSNKPNQLTSTTDRSYVEQYCGAKPSAGFNSYAHMDQSVYGVRRSGQLKTCGATGRCMSGEIFNLIKGTVKRTPGTDQTRDPGRGTLTARHRVSVRVNQPPYDSPAPCRPRAEPPQRSTQLIHCPPFPTSKPEYKL